MAKEKSRILEKLNLKKEKYFLVTAHRQENVDNKERLKGILEGFRLIYDKFNLLLFYPIHPRTQKRIKKFRLRVPEGIELIDPVRFLDFLQLEMNAKLVLTDSGGGQEETCILKVPCVTLRDNTERPETLEIGSNVLAGATPQRIFNETKIMLKKNIDWKNPFGDGKAAKKIVDILFNHS